MARVDPMDWSLAQITASGVSRDTAFRELHQISELVHELQANLYEEMHPDSERGYSALALKLERDDPLDAEDRARLRCWVIAETEACERMEMEGQFDIEAFNRAIGELAELNQQERTVESIGKLAGVLRDVDCRLARITSHKRDQLRVETLEKACADLSPSNRRLVAGQAPWRRFLP